MFNETSDMTGAVPGLSLSFRQRAASSSLVRPHHEGSAEVSTFWECLLAKACGTCCLLGPWLSIAVLRLLGPQA